MPAALLSAEDREELLGKLTEMKSVYRKYDDEIKKLGQADSDTLVKIDKLTEDMVAIHKKHNDEAVKRIDEIEIKLTRKAAEMEPPKSFGQRLVEDPGLLKFLQSGASGSYTATVKSWRFEQKAITGVGALIAQTQPGISVGPRLPIGVRQLVPQGRTTAGAISYLRETAFTNAAAVVAEGAAKPYSDKTFAAVIAPVTTIATLFKVSKQSYEDVPGLGAQIESNGIYGVQKVEDNQLLNGSGTAPQLQGFMGIATAAPVPGTAAAGFTIIDAVGAAIFDLAGKGYMADGVVMNPTNWGTMAMLKNTQGNYLFANPIDYSATSRIWGLSMVLSSSMAVDSFLVGAFQGNSLILDREELNVQVAETNVDDFEKNMLTVRVEERLALLIYNAAAFEKGVKPVLLGAESSPEASPEKGKR